MIFVWKKLRIQKFGKEITTSTSQAPAWEGNIQGKLNTKKINIRSTYEKKI